MKLVLGNWNKEKKTQNTKKLCGITKCFWRYRMHATNATPTKHFASYERKGAQTHRTVNFI